MIKKNKISTPTNLLQQKKPTVEIRSTSQDHNVQLLKEKNLLQHKESTVEIREGQRIDVYNLASIKEGLIDLPRKIKRLLPQESRIKEPKFHFGTSRKEIKENFKILEKENFNLEKLLNDNRSITAYGLEFKETEQLRDLLGRHPRWSTLESQLKNGVNFPIKNLERQTYLKDLVGALKQGNHKSASKFSETLVKTIRKKIKFGWMIPFKTVDTIKILGIKLAP